MRVIVQEKIVAGCAGKGSYPAVWLQCPDTRIAPIVSMLRGQPLWSPRLPPSGTSATATPPIQGRRLDPSDLGWRDNRNHLSARDRHAKPKPFRRDRSAEGRLEPQVAERAGEPAIWEGACGLPTAERREEAV
jgi:hypothetical protein